MSTYTVQREVFKVATKAGWPEKEPSVLGTWEGDRKLQAACRYIAENGEALNMLTPERRDWICRIAGREHP